MDKVKDNINSILYNFDEMDIYTYNPRDVKLITDNFFTVSSIIVRIIYILQKDITILEKKGLLTKMELFDNSTIDLIINNETHYKSILNVYSLFKEHELQSGGGFYPLKDLEENVPMSSIIIGWALFFSTVIASFTKIISPFVKQIMKFGVDMFWTMIGAIPLFGFDPIVSAISVPMKYGFNIYMDFVIGLIEATPNIYKFMIQLSRKNFGEAIEEFSKTTVLFTQLYNLLSKALPVLNDNLIFLTEYLPVIIKFAEPFAAIFLKTLSRMNDFVHNFIGNKKSYFSNAVKSISSKPGLYSSSNNQNQKPAPAPEPAPAPIPAPTQEELSAPLPEPPPELSKKELKQFNKAKRKREKQRIKKQTKEAKKQTKEAKKQAKDLKRQEKKGKKHKTSGWGPSFSDWKLGTSIASLT